MSEKINWPPTDIDFLQVARTARRKNPKFTNVLMYLDNQEILIYDPVHFSPAPQHIKSFSTTDKNNNTTQFNVILSQYD